jgi:hypothetical protein
MGSYGLDSLGSDTSRQVNELLGSMKCWEIRGEPSDKQRLKQGSSAWSRLISRFVTLPPKPKQSSYCNYCTLHYILIIIIRMTMPRRMNWARYVARTEEMRT